jgi:TolB protein
MATWPNWKAVPLNAAEPNLADVRQLTFGGQNAEAYWNVDGTKLIYQTHQPEWPDEQIITMNADGSDKKLVSTGKGRCTCSYFLPDMSGIVFSSTHERNEGAQKPIDMSKGYVWMVNPDFAIYRANVDGSNLRSVIKRNGYVAETTVAPNGKYMVFTGNYEGDLEIYRSRLDGSGIKKLTDEKGYDGGPFVSWDSKKIAYRRGALTTDQEAKDYVELLAQNLIRPTKLEIWVMDADGSNRRQVTKLNAASFAPFIHPDGKRLVFSSNYGDPKGREFDIFMINLDGTGLKRITNTPQFDGFPMFTKDGKKLVFASNRHGAAQGDTNIFTARWVD